MSKVRALFFDLDGTLIDTIHDLKAAVDHALLLRGKKPHPVSSYLSYIGRGSRHLISSALATDDEQEISDCYDDYMEYYLNHIADRSTPYPGIATVLRRAQQFGYDLIVFTNKPLEAATPLIKKIFPEIKFKAIISPSKEFPPKPNPAGLSHAIAELHYEADEIMFIGDSDVDMEVAQAAGISWRVGASYGYQDRTRLLDSGARAVIDNPRELNRIIDRAGFAHNISFACIVLLLVAVLIAIAALIAIWSSKALIQSTAISAGALLLAYYLGSAILTFTHRYYFAPAGIASSTALAAGTLLICYVFSGIEHQFSYDNIVDLSLFISGICFIGLGVFIALYSIIKISKSLHNCRLIRHRNQIETDSEI